jgi:hypothetical protein
MIDYIELAAPVLGKFHLVNRRQSEHEERTERALSLKPWLPNVLETVVKHFVT